MPTQHPGQTDKRTDFAELRAAFSALSDVFQVNGKIKDEKSGLSLLNIPRSKWRSVSSAIQRHEDVVRKIIKGSGKKTSLQGAHEVVLAVKGAREGILEVCALRVEARGPVVDSIALSSKDKGWRRTLSDFFSAHPVAAVIPAAEGNNQRAAVGLVLQLCGIGRGHLTMVETDVPEELDEAAHMVRGADWLKAGLPRFESAAGEALWYLMRIRSVHARIVKERKQGQYTAMAIAALKAVGLGVDEISDTLSLSESLVQKLTPKRPRVPGQNVDLSLLGEEYNIPSSNEQIRFCAERVWKGAAIYTRVLDRRIRISEAARSRLGEGMDLISIGRALKISTRDLIRVLSVSHKDAVDERERFVGALVGPEILRRITRAE